MRKARVKGYLGHGSRGGDICGKKRIREGRARGRAWSREGEQALRRKDDDWRTWKFHKKHTGQ